MWAVAVASEESGVDIPRLNQSRNTVLNATFGPAGPSERGLVVNNEALALELASRTPFDQPIVLVNSEEYGGIGSDIPTFSLNPLGTGVFIHELGHALGLIGDNYYYYSDRIPQWQPPPSVVPYRKTQPLGFFLSDVKTRRLSALGFQGGRLPSVLQKFFPSESASTLHESIIPGIGDNGLLELEPQEFAFNAKRSFRTLGPQTKGVDSSLPRNHSFFGSLGNVKWASLLNRSSASVELQYPDPRFISKSGSRSLIVPGPALSAGESLNLIMGTPAQVNGWLLYLEKLNWKGRDYVQGDGFSLLQQSFRGTLSKEAQPFYTVTIAGEKISKASQNSWLILQFSEAWVRDAVFETALTSAHVLAFSSRTFDPNLVGAYRGSGSGLNDTWRSSYMSNMSDASLAFDFVERHILKKSIESYLGGQ